MTTIIERDGLKFACDDPIETWRAETLATKEPGTLRWLAHAREGDVVYDVGANIGVYTLLAARQVGPTGHVYAFEPHAANLASLLRNVALNGFTDRVTVVACALGAAPGFAPFYYSALRAGSSGSQLGHTTAEHGAPFTPLTMALTVVTTIDTLLKAGLVRPAARVKIDVDGNEPAVLAGMKRCWARTPPSSVQVETRARTKPEITAVLWDAGYELTERHDTAHGTEQIAKGVHPDALAYNLVFERAT